MCYIFRKQRMQGCQIQPSLQDDKDKDKIKDKGKDNVKCQMLNFECGVSNVKCRVWKAEYYQDIFTIFS